eukprot:1378748-Rhodomonas_salina.1
MLCRYQTSHTRCLVAAYAMSVPDIAYQMHKTVPIVEKETKLEAMPVPDIAYHIHSPLPHRCAKKSRARSAPQINRTLHTLSQYRTSRIRCVGRQLAVHYRSIGHRVGSA